MYYLYGETVVYYFKHILLVDKVLLPFATHHRFIRSVSTMTLTDFLLTVFLSFMLYVMGRTIFPRPRSRKLTIYYRFCVLRRLLKERALPLSGKSTTALLACSGRILTGHLEVHTICLDSYGMHPISKRNRKLPLINSQALYIIVFQVHYPNPSPQHPYSIYLLLDLSQSSLSL